MLFETQSAHFETQTRIFETQNTHFETQAHFSDSNRIILNNVFMRLIFAYALVHIVLQ
jgi:hypothetical protein